MRRVNVATRRGTARTGRWLARALFVAGGALAATAVGWAISTSSASAEEVTNPTEVIKDLTHGLAGLTSATTGLGLERPAEKHPRIAAEVRNTMDSVAQVTLLRPAERLLSSVQQITGDPQGLGLPRVIGHALAPPQNLLGMVASSTGELINVTAPGTTHPGQRTHEPAAESLSPVHTPEDAAAPAVTVPQWPAAPSGAYPTVRGHRGDLPAHRVPASPLRESPVPANVPAMPNGSVSGSHVDGPVFAVPASTLVIAPSRLASAATFDSWHLPVQHGTQPGVTPD